MARRQGARLIEIHALLTRARIGRATGAEPAVVRADLDAARTLALATKRSPSTSPRRIPVMVGEVKGRLYR